MCQYFQLALWFLTVFRLRKWYEWQLCTPRVDRGGGWWRQALLSRAFSKKSSDKRDRLSTNMSQRPASHWSGASKARPQGSARIRIANVASHVRAPERAFHLCSFMLFHSHMRHVFFGLLCICIHDLISLILYINSQTYFHPGSYMTEG